MTQTQTELLISKTLAHIGRLRRRPATTKEWRALWTKIEIRVQQEIGDRHISDGVTVTKALLDAVETRFPKQRDCVAVEDPNQIHLFE